MKKLPVPLCVCCKKSRAEWESEAWPSLLLCYRCIYEFNGAMVRNNITIDNPFMLEINRNVYPLIESRGETYQEIWYPSLEHHSSSRLLIRIPKKIEDNP